MKRLLAVGALGALALLLFAVLAGADDGKGELRSGGDGAVTFAIFGDAPYATVNPDYTVAPTNPDHAQFDASDEFVEAVNADKRVKLVLFAGDIHSGKEPCSFTYDRAIYDLWSNFRDPLIYTPGDNEWADCHKSNQAGAKQFPANSGDYINYAAGNPVANLGLVRQLYFAEPGRALGGEDKKVLSQAQVNDTAHPNDAQYVENVMWEQAGVLFVTLNIPGGSNNDTDAWFGAVETDMQKQERKQRTEADLRWLDAAFAQATADKVVGVVIMEQGDVWDLDGKAVAANHLAGYETLIQKIADKTHDFAPKPVLLFNGDSHFYRSDDPLKNNAACLTETATFPTTTACTTGVSLADAHDTHGAGFDPYGPDGLTNFHRLVVHGATQPFEYLRVTVNTKNPPAASGTSFGPFRWERVQP